MIRIICPYCHTTLAATELETATLGQQICLVCPECATILVTDDEHAQTVAVPHEAVANA